MAIFRQLLETAGEKLTKDKEERAQEQAFVRNNEGSKAICEYMVNLFQKGNSRSVSLCYMQPGDGKSFSGMKTKDIEVAQYSFEEMYNWYGLAESVGYASLTSRTQLNELQWMIESEVQKLPHIKYNAGFLVKMFQ